MYKPLCLEGARTDLQAVELDEMIDMEMERKVKPVLCNDSSH